MALLGCSALSMAPHSSDIDSPVPRKPLPTKTTFSSQNHEIYIRTKQTQHIDLRPLNGTSKMFCASNDTTLVWYRFACSEKTSPDENSNFGQKHKIHIHAKETQHVELRPLNDTSKMFCASNDATLVWYRLTCSENTSPDENSNLWWKSWSTHSHKANNTLNGNP